MLRSPGGSKRGSTVTRLPRKRLVVPAAVVAILLAAVLVATAAAPPNIDTFDDAQAALISLISGSPPGPLATGSVMEPSGAGRILGTERDVTVQSTAGPNGGATTVYAQSSAYYHSQTADTFGRSTLVYDGADGSLTVNPVGLGGVDLTQGNNANGFRFVLLFDDLPMDVRIKVYTSATAYSEKIFTDLFPGGISAAPRDIYVEFAEILTGTPGAGGPANFKSVGAVEFEFIGKIPATDIQIGLIDVYILDWGDLPDSSVGGAHPNYPTRLVNDGPRHVVNSLFLGNRIDPSPNSAGEFDGQPSLNADRDDLAQTDDEDGVVRTPGVTWSQASGGQLDVTVTGGPGCLSGWIDWNGDGSFSGAGERILDNVEMNTAGTVTLAFPIPVAMPDATGVEQSFYARFRLYPRNPAEYLFGDLQFAEGCTRPKSPAGRFMYIGGEVEDYLWRFGGGGRNCTLTPGYWKTHSSFGPASYDATWGLLGENTPFFLSGQTYYKVLWTVPGKGGAYYILAHQYIAAQLNFLQGASSPAQVTSDWNAATTLFQTYTPAQVAGMKNGAIRDQFIMLAGSLDAYNNGLTGPGHCE